MGLSIFREQLLDFVQLGWRGRMCADGLQDELRGRAAECAINKVGDELALRLIATKARLVDVRARRLVAGDQSLFRHDLHQFQRRRVAGFAGLGERFVHVPDGCGTALPEHTKNGEFGVSRAREGFGHGHG